MNPETCQKRTMLLTLTLRYKAHQSLLQLVHTPAQATLPSRKCTAQTHGATVISLIGSPNCLLSTLTTVSFNKRGGLGDNATGPHPTGRPRATAQHGPLPHTDPDLHFRLTCSCVLFETPPGAAPVALRPMAGWNLVAHSAAPASSIFVSSRQ